MEAEISRIRFTGSQDLLYQRLSPGDTQKEESTKSPKVMESSIIQLIRMMKLGKVVDIEI